jgi:hypothetical protein
MPPSILEAPGKAAWPPLLTAKGHFVRRANSIRLETSTAVSGVKVHRGSTSSCCIDQYVVGAALDTFAAPKTSFRELHCPVMISEVCKKRSTGLTAIAQPFNEVSTARPVNSGMADTLMPLPVRASVTLKSAGSKTCWGDAPAATATAPRNNFWTNLMTTGVDSRRSKDSTRNLCGRNVKREAPIARDKPSDQICGALKANSGYGTCRSISVVVNLLILAAAF